jgi:hypothetical protein
VTDGVNVVYHCVIADQRHAAYTPPTRRGAAQSKRRVDCTGDEVPLLREYCARLLHHAQQITALQHLHDDVATTHQFALDIQLRDRRPIRI